jgi:sugar diacid utilization regulator
VTKATKRKTAEKPQKPNDGDVFSRLDAVSAAVESGAGLAAVTRAVAAALVASIAVIDGRGAVLAVAAASPEDEKRLLAGEAGTSSHELTVAEQRVGKLLARSRSDAKLDTTALRMVGTLIALEVERTLAPELADQEVASGFIGELINGELKDAGPVSERAKSLGVDVGRGCAVILVRAVPRRAVGDDWRERALLVVERAARALHSGGVCALVERENVAAGEIFVLLGASDAVAVEKAAAAIREEAEASLAEFSLTIGFGRVTTNAGELFRAGQEALLAVNVAEAGGSENLLSFESTGAYRLLLPALCDDPGELLRFYAETIEPLVKYDEQYETELVLTVETFLAADANVAGTAQRLFTHRHTVRYRLERVKEITGLDCSSTDGRERLSLGLKSMRVLGIANPGGPAGERGAEGGRVPAA